MVLALFLARKESATPPMAPDRPWLLPDWNSTIRMIARPQSSCKIVTTVFIVDNLRTFIRAQAQKIILQKFIIP
jgi:hypothetical protein